MKIFSILTAVLLLPVTSHAAAPSTVYNANDTAAVRIVGRTLAMPDGKSVRFDFSGTYAETELDGRQLKLRLSGTGKSYFDVTVDGQPAGKFLACSNDTVITVADALKRGRHTISIRKRTEGETGMTTFHEFIVPAGARLTATKPRGRFIEFIGNSLSAGFGTEGLSRDEPFTPENENCNLAYSTIVPRYFDADYAIIAHSGWGAVRNWGDPLRQSVKSMKDKYTQTLDMDTLPAWDFTAYRPDLVVINLGANDFSTEPHPYRSEFVAGYTQILKTIKEKYGDDINILCIIPYAVNVPVEDYYAEAVANAGGGNVRIIRMPEDYINPTTDRGAVWHPNYQGQKKMSMLVIPYISTMMGWELTDKPVE